MKTMMLGLLAETAIHPGAGRSTGFVDLPVAREAATDYPVIVGSSFKGALRERSRHHLDDEALSDSFGDQDRAGGVMFSDARLLLLPVRSLSGAYRWVTCPHLIERFERDRMRAGIDGEIKRPNVHKLSSSEALGSTQGENIFLEERQFTTSNLCDDAVERAIAPLIKSPGARSRLARQLVVLTDEDFSWFARYGLGVQARNVLEKETKRSTNLWYEETIPADALFYAILHERQRNALSTLEASFTQNPYVRMGGNETVGQGWFALTTHAQGGK